MSTQNKLGDELQATRIAKSADYIIIPSSLSWIRSVTALRCMMNSKASATTVIAHFVSKDIRMFTGGLYRRDGNI